MATTTNNETATAFDLKGAAFTIPVLSLRSGDLDKVSTQLIKKVRQAPSFFYNAPVVLNLQHVPEANRHEFDLARLINLVRGQGLIPVGITGCAESLRERARSMELAVLTTRSGGRQPEESVDSDVGEPKEEIAGDSGLDSAQGEQAGGLAASTMLTEPVRSGQRIVAEQGDLIVMAPVSSGAEITTPGNIHVYGPLRGRAFAGSNGDENARIFCQCLEAELVAVAGVYLVNEKFPASLRSLPVQIHLQTGRIRISAL
jgi:septum site-determining protein MinC